MHRCALVAEQQSRTHIVGECELYEEERDTLGGDEENDECDMQKFDKVDSSEKAIAILGGRWWSQAAEQEGDKIRTSFRYNIRKKT